MNVVRWCWAAVLVGGVAIAEEPARVEAGPGPAPSIRVVATGSPVFVPSCRGVVWERFEAESQAYVPLVARPCGPLAPAVRVGPDGVEFPVDVDVAEGGIIRAVVVVGTGCTADQPFPLAECVQVHSLLGPTQGVRGVAE